MRNVCTWIRVYTYVLCRVGASHSSQISDPLCHPLVPSAVPQKLRHAAEAHVEKQLRPLPLVPAPRV